MQVGYVGLGNMGSALAARVQREHALIVFDPSPAATAILVNQGARRAASLAELASQCDVILLCLPTSKFVRDVLFGAEGMHDHLRPGTLLIDQTTGDPADTREMAATLAAAGVNLIDAPVSGGRAGAEAGTIAIMVGAGQALFDAALPVLRSISGNVVHAGDVGNGHVIKLVNNLMSTTQRLLSFEAVALAAKCGVDPEIATEILTMGGGRNAYLEKMMGPRVLKGKLSPGFTLGLAHKDIRLACQLGDDAGVPMFFGNVARELYQICKNEMGADSQVDTVGLFYDRVAKTHVVPEDHDAVI